jgi:hypothetical protein
MKKLCRGCVVKMKASSGMMGYGNLQCVSSYIEPLSEVYFFGHNQGYHDYDIAEIVEAPKDAPPESGAQPPQADNNRYANEYSAWLLRVDDKDVDSYHAFRAGWAAALKNCGTQSASTNSAMDAIVLIIKTFRSANHSLDFYRWFNDHVQEFSDIVAKQQHQ